MLGCFSHVQLFVIAWTVAHQDPLSIGFPRQEYWSGLPFLLQGIFLTQGSNPSLLDWQEDSLPLSHLGRPLLFCESESEVTQLYPDSLRPHGL